MNKSQEEENYEGVTELMFQRIGSPTAPLADEDDDEQEEEFQITKPTFQNEEEEEQKVSDIKKIAHQLE